jgi:hypothetical protein
MPADLGFDFLATASRSQWVTVPTGGTGPGKEQRMTSKQSVAVVELDWRWLPVPAVDHGRTPRDSRLSMNDGDAIAAPADWTRPSLAA